MKPWSDERRRVAWPVGDSLEYVARHIERSVAATADS
jgi:hypothetical protein